MTVSVSATTFSILVSGFVADFFTNLVAGLVSVETLATFKRDMIFWTI